MKAIAAEILGLFVDDQGLALTMLGVVVVAAMAASACTRRRWPASCWCSGVWARWW